MSRCISVAAGIYRSVVFMHAAHDLLCIWEILNGFILHYSLPGVCLTEDVGILYKWWGEKTGDSPRWLLFVTVSQPCGTCNRWTTSEPQADAGTAAFSPPLESSGVNYQRLTHLQKKRLSWFFNPLFFWHSIRSLRVLGLSNAPYICFCYMSVCS